MGPTLRLERKFWEAGDQVVCGIDEVGRGAWAGPVTVAAVVPAPEHVRGVRDSKQLTPRPSARRRRARCAAGPSPSASGTPSYEECDELGMTAALRAAGHARAGAARRAGLRPRPHRARRQPRLPADAGAGHHRDQGRRHVPRGGGGVVRGEGHPRPHDDRGGRALPAVRLRVERGYPAPGRTRPRSPATARARSTVGRGSSWRAVLARAPACRRAGSSYV